MEIWKIDKFCETATYSQLLEKEQTLREMIERGELKRTNAEFALITIQQNINYRKLFGEDQ